MLLATGRTIVLALTASSWACTLDNPSYMASSGASGSGSDSGFGSDANSGSESTSSSNSGNETSGGTSSGGSSSGGTDSDNSGSDASSSGSTGNTSEETGGPGETDPTSGNDNSCGDGELTDNEECDDGNTEDGDGCSKYCHKEPTGISFSGEEWTELAGTDKVKNQANAGCGAIVQVAGKIEMGGNFPCDLEVSCISEIDIQKGEIVFPFPATVGFYGQCYPAAGDPWVRPCDDGQVIVGFTGRYAGAIDILGFRCRKIKLNEDTMEKPFEISFDGPPVPLMPVGSMMPGPPWFGNIDCPDGQIATGAKFYSEGYDLQGLKLRCSHMKLEYNN